MTNDDRICAVHEAAHAVIAAMGGVDVKCIVLHRGTYQGARGAERGRCELHDYAAERDVDAPRFLVYLLAGAAAERRLTGTYSERDGDDVEQAVYLASAMLNVAPDSPRVRASVQAAQTVANAHMQNDVVWSWIERVAKALVRHRRLTGRRVAELREPQR